MIHSHAHTTHAQKKNVPSIRRPSDRNGTWASVSIRMLCVFIFISSVSIWFRVCFALSFSYCYYTRFSGEQYWACILFVWTKRTACWMIFWHYVRASTSQPVAVIYIYTWCVASRCIACVCVWTIVVYITVLSRYHSGSHSLTTCTDVERYSGYETSNVERPWRSKVLFFFFVSIWCGVNEMCLWEW